MDAHDSRTLAEILRDKATLSSDELAKLVAVAKTRQKQSKIVGDPAKKDPAIGARGRR